MKQLISTPHATDWGDIPHSQGVAVPGLVFVSGQLGVDLETGKPAQGIHAQTEAVLRQIQAILEAAGCGMADVVKTNCYLTDRGRDYAGFNEIYRKFFPDPSAYPARVTVEVSALAPGCCIEIDAIAVRKIKER
ncbi:Enamine/imine deaminase (plasmid) [Variovorax sp. SRS16]|uniref:RidA family protein n=1 Tax=Variovorax sp. SRS16 TaxID=282217 RepID=UPI0013180BEC|nr:RidA family protein [Variovorax sp. SRS16]VTU46468.1 Enamine/imine deaminase [Variovorax sp. SRS16]